MKGYPRGWLCKAYLGIFATAWSPSHVDHNFTGKGMMKSATDKRLAAQGCVTDARKGVTN